MNRLSWDTTAPRRPRRVREPRPDDRAFETESDLLRPAWDELRKIHRF
jgi:hypothetical protein